jgi:SAM-dependent methyltransferase
MASERHTASYFEGHAHDYDPRRLETAAAWVRELAGDDDALFDVGCGTGQVLLAMQEAGVRRLAGCDLARAALAAAEGRVEFTAHRDSVLDEGFVAGLAGSFRFVTMSAVAHHLVGPTRHRSRALARLALRNALLLLEPGGYLVVIEPTFEPRWAMTAVFWAKRVLAPLGRRIELGKWNNLGAPLVSYYGRGDMRELIAAAGGRVDRHHDEETPLRRLPRTLGVRGRWMTTLLVRAASSD